MISLSKGVPFRVGQGRRHKGLCPHVGRRVGNCFRFDYLKYIWEIGFSMRYKIFRSRSAPEGRTPNSG